MFIIAVLWTAFFVVNLNIAMMIPLLPFIQRDVGLSAAQSGWVLAAFPIASLVGNLSLGPFIDRFGRKRFIVLGASGATVIFLATAASASAGPIIAGRAAAGLFMPMVGASVFAAIADYRAVADRPRVAGIVTSRRTHRVPMRHVDGRAARRAVRLAIAAAVAGADHAGLGDQRGRPARHAAGGAVDRADLRAVLSGAAAVAVARPGDAAIAAILFRLGGSGVRFHGVVSKLGRYGVFAFVRDLMLALLLGGAMLLVPAARRGSLNAVLNAIYQTGATLGGLASAWLYALRPDFMGDALLAGLLFAAAGFMLWTVPRLRTAPVPIL